MAPGTSKSGKLMDTCCKSCATDSGGHDRECDERQKTAAQAGLAPMQGWDCFSDQDRFPSQDVHVMEAGDADPPDYEKCKGLAVDKGFGAVAVRRSGRVFFRAQPALQCRGNIVSAAKGVKLFIMNENSGGIAGSPDEQNGAGQYRCDSQAPEK